MQKLGVVFGGADYFPNRRVRDITRCTKRFYQEWDDALYGKYIRDFNIDESKKLKELSSGMKVKYSLAVALSHHAKLFFFDEPTSGLDPVARDEVLDIFRGLIADGTRSIIFSTHITSDLDKCADYITYISNGRIKTSNTRDDLLEEHRIISGEKALLAAIAPKTIAYKTTEYGFTALIKTADIPEGDPYKVARANVDDIMIYYSLKEKSNEKSVI